MKALFRPVLEEAIVTGIRDGYKRAFKHVDRPHDELIFEAIEDRIWLEIDKFFSFEDEQS